MKRYLFFTFFLLFEWATPQSVQNDFEKDTIHTSKGDLEITFIGHGTLMFRFGGKVIHVDPVERFADYSKMPQGDIILVTHEHGDHFDPGTIERIAQEETDVLLPKSCLSQFEKGTPINNGETMMIQGISITAVPAYNIVHMRSEGKPFHPKGRGNGYVVTFGDKKVYVAGDTENVPEMEDLEDIECAFLPMNLPYTMTPQMVAEAAKAINPKILYPYHFGDTDPLELQELLKDYKEIEIRIRRMK